MSLYSSHEQNSFSRSDNEEKEELSDINYYNQYNTQSCTNKCNIYKSDSDSIDQNTIEDFIKKEFIEKMNRNETEKEMEDNSSEMDPYEIKREHKEIISIILITVMFKQLN